MSKSNPDDHRGCTDAGAECDDPVKRCPQSCPDVSFFEGSKKRANYFGFDHKTNLVVTPGTGEYWLPTPERGTLSVPSNRETRDGARWVSVAIGKETEVEIHFAFKRDHCIPCVATCTYEVKPTNIAEVVTTKITAQMAAFKIKGKAEGEASLKVICDGADIGWFHIWSKAEATLRVDVVNLVTTRAPLDAFDLAALRVAFEEIFKQSVLKIDIMSLGNVDLSGDAALATIESNRYSSSGELSVSNGLGFLSALHTKASAALDARATAPLPRANAYRIYRYVPTGATDAAGMALNIGASPAFSFMSDSAAARNSMAHELGHCLGLRHPSSGASGSQYASHNLASTNHATPAYAATNTELASPASEARENVMANDPTNLMGYWPDKANRKPMRYHQWKVCSRS